MILSFERKNLSFLIYPWEPICEGVKHSPPNLKVSRCRWHRHYIWYLRLRSYKSRKVFSVGFSLFPKDEKFFEKFAEQAKLVAKICEKFQDLLVNYENVEEKVNKINLIEGEGDDLCYDVCVRLAKTFVTPIDREDIYTLAQSMDDIIDFIQGAAVRLRFFKLKEPNEGLIELSNILVDCSHLLTEGIDLLPKFQDIAKIRRKVSKLETRADHINREATAKLFESCETVPDILLLIKWKEVIEKAENAVDKFDDVFDVLESVVIKHA